MLVSLLSIDKQSTHNHDAIESSIWPLKLNCWDLQSEYDTLSTHKRVSQRRVDVEKTQSEHVHQVECLS